MEGAKLFSVILGLILLAAGTVNALLMSEVLGRHSNNRGFRAIHRWLGRSFAAIFAGFFIYMLPRIGYFANLATYQMLHAFVSKPIKVQDLLTTIEELTLTIPGEIRTDKVDAELKEACCY